MRTIHDREYEAQPTCLTQLEGESIAYKIDFSRSQKSRGADIVSAEWVVRGGQVSVSNETLQNNICTANISSPISNHSGLARVRVIATQDDGSVRIKHLNIKVRDQYNRSGNDYYGDLY